MELNSSVSNELRQVAWAGLLRASAQLIARMDAELTSRGLLSMTWYDVLFQLKRAKENRLRLSELAEQVILSRSGLSRLVDRVEAAGFLKREIAVEDRRGAYAVLLPAGDDALRQTWNVYEGLILQHFGSQLTDDEARTLHTIFARLSVTDVTTSDPVPLGVRRSHPSSS